MIIGTIFKDIGKSAVWIGKEAEELVVDVPKALSKLITLSGDAKIIASDAGNEVITLSGDVTALVAAVGKDDGASLQAIEALIVAGGTAVKGDGLIVADDVAVFAAAQTFFKSLNGTNYSDVLTAISKIIADGKRLSSTVIADFEKLEADA
jgi:hypothetical protein